MKTNNLYILVFVFFLSLSTAGLSQNKVIDSLKNELSIHTQKDSVRVNLLNTIAFKNYGINQDKLKEYADQSNELANEIGFLNGEARSWYLRSIFHLSKGDLEKASTTIDQSLRLYTKANNTIRISTCYDLIGTISQFQEDYDKSILYYNKALEIAKDKGDQLKAAGYISNIGRIYCIKGDLDKGVSFYKDAILIYNNLNEGKRTLSPLSNIALTYTQQGRHIEALKYIKKCLSGFREHGNKIYGSNILLNTGILYSSLEEYDKALPYIQESLELNKELKNELEISKCIMSLGVIYRSKKEYDKALDYFNEALIICDKIDSSEGKSNCYSNIGSLQIEKGEYNQALITHKKGQELNLALGRKHAIAESYVASGIAYYNLGNNKEAFNNALKGKKIADELSLLKIQQEANLLLSELYAANNNHKESLERYKQYKAQSDSLLNKESVKEITKLEYEYKYKKELESANLRELRLTRTVKSTSQDLEKSQRNLLLGVIAFLIMTLILGAIIFYLKLRNEKSKTQNIAIEQKLLRSQMTPHFIFNSLSVLQGMILNKEYKKSILYLSKFSKLLRITLENSRDKMVPLYEELTAVNNYLELQNLEVSQSYQYTILVDDNIDESLFEIPPMLIQPFIENAIEHGFKNQKENRKIDVQLTYSNKELICTIKDNGVGIDAKKEVSKTQKKSLATTITSERLKTLSKDFKTKSTITIEDRKKYNEQGTIVTLVIPYKISNI